MRLAAAALAALTLLQGSTDRIRTQSLGVSDNLYLLSGGGGNSLMMTADTGVVLIDAKSSGKGTTIADIASGISDQPVTTLVYTHAHADHSEGGTDIPTLTRIIAHERTKANMVRMPSFAGSSSRFLPGSTFADTLTIGDGLDRIDLRYFGPAHTDGDIVALFPGKRVAYVGDLFPGKTVPVIDTANGGSGLAWPDTLARLIPALQGITRIIPGHAVPPPGSPLGRWVTLADLQEYANFTRDLRTAVEDGFKAGRSADEIASALTLRDRYAAYNFDGAPAAVRAIYDELKQSQAR